MHNEQNKKILTVSDSIGVTDFPGPQAPEKHSSKTVYLRYLPPKLLVCKFQVAQPDIHLVNIEDDEVDPPTTCLSTAGLPNGESRLLYMEPSVYRLEGIVGSKTYILD